MSVLGRTDLDGNAQADLKNHGGPDKAVCCYSAEHYPDWRNTLGLSEDEFGYGAFGENFTLSGFTEDAVCLGDIYTVGTAKVQVSQPRMPCWKVGRRWERPDLPGEMTATGRTGFYLRVLEEGEVGAGDTLTLQTAPCRTAPSRGSTTPCTSIKTIRCKMKSFRACRSSPKPGGGRSAAAPGC